MKGRSFLIPAFCLLYSLSALAAQQRAPTGVTLAERYNRAQQKLAEERGNEDKTRAERDRLAEEAEDLQKRLIANAAKVQELEAAYDVTAGELERLNATLTGLEADLARDRDRVAHLLAVLQRLQTEAPPALALRPDDSLAATRGALQMGAMLTPVYRDAADLAERVKTLSLARQAVALKGEQARGEAEALKTARASLDRLLQEKNIAQAEADERLSELHDIIEEVGRETNDLRSLIARIATLRAGAAAPSGMTVVTPQRTRAASLARGSLRLPVVGNAVPGDPAGPGRTPGANGPQGLWFEASGNAEAIAPGDSEVVFAGNYQKFGQVLILELAGGYHLTLAGLGRIDVHIGDLVLAGEPVGILAGGKAARLYMELRRNGQSVDPAPWMSAELGKAKGT